jgi:hypothetical protein
MRRLEPLQDRVQGSLVGGVDRVEHAPELVVEWRTQTGVAQQNVVGLGPPLAQERTVELLHRRDSPSLAGSVSESGSGSSGRPIRRR